MIGYYVHHHGRGHLHRAQAIARELGVPVTGLSSLSRPEGWAGDWLLLERDDAADPVVEPRAGGVLHWAPLGDDGLSARMAAISSWISREHPRAVVVDVSVEVALLCRLHGVPVVTVAMPGERTDLPHSLGYAVSSAIIGAWPASALGMLRATDATDARLTPVGGISRFMGREVPAAVGGRRALVLLGGGGDDVGGDLLAAAKRETPDWQWDVVGGGSGRWVDDPWELICRASVVITHAGQNSVADVAAARRPAIIVPQARPHGEQVATGGVLASGAWPAVVVPRFPETGWPALLDRAVSLDGEGWQRWTDGGGARRAADVVRAVAEQNP